MADPKKTKELCGCGATHEGQVESLMDSIVPIYKPKGSGFVIVCEVKNSRVTMEGLSFEAKKTISLKHVTPAEVLKVLEDVAKEVANPHKRH